MAMGRRCRGTALLLLGLGLGLRPTFIHTAAWLDLDDLKSDNTLPLVTDLGLNLGLGPQGLNGTSGSCSFIADFGVLDLPLLGPMRSRAGLRCSPLYPRGALELGFRKELRTDKVQGYQLFMGLQSTGDDERLDILTEVGAIKLFQNARAFYRFLWGCGGPFDSEAGGPSWNQLGSSLGVTQTRLPPTQQGRLTIGWRTGLFDVGLEGGKVLPPMMTRRKAQKKKRGLRDNLLDSSPFIAYSMDLPRSTQVTWTLVPEHGVLEHALQWRSQRDPTGGKTLVTMVLEQSLHSRDARLRIGTCYERK
ncbi:unnamed protein product [Durusdinium trenchii]|uniref:Uncharacterized protein n=2 Tax=Durusdinium trenchii TaxID=1381693 RepID=A0ABP0MBB4_9DINO